MNNESKPKRFIFELTELCNYRCGHCFLPGYKKRGPTTKEAIYIADKVIDAGISSISWTGGEPYLRNDLFDIMGGVKKSDLIHTINTNGSLITNEIAKKTKDYFSLARVSVYGSKDSFNKNSQCPKKFDYETSFRAIEKFLKNDLPVQVNIPVFSVDEVKLISGDVEKRFGKSLEEVVYIPIISIGEKEGVVKYPTGEEIDERIPKDMSSKTRLFEWKPGKHMVMRADMNVYAHPIFDNKEGCLRVGNILEESIESLWEKFPEEFKKDHERLTPDINHLK